MIVSALSSTLLRSKFMSPTYSHYIDKLIVIIPPESLLGSFQKLFCGFDKFVWLSLLVAFVAIFFVYEAVKIVYPKFYQNFLIGNNIKNLNMFNAFLGGSQHKLPTTTFARYLLAMHLIFYLVVRSMYQGALFKVLKSNIYVKGIETLSDINELGYTFYMTEGTELK